MHDVERKNIFILYEGNGGSWKPAAYPPLTDYRAELDLSRYSDRSVKTAIILAQRNAEKVSLWEREGTRLVNV